MAKVIFYEPQIKGFDPLLALFPFLYYAIALGFITKN